MKIVIPTTVSVVIASGPLQMISLSSAFFSSAARWTAIGACFYEIKFTSISAEPINLAAAQFLEYAMVPGHLPALVSTFDAAPAPISSTAALMTLPGATRCQQGCGMPRAASIPLNIPWCQIARVTADVPVVGFLAVSLAQNTVFNVYLHARVRGWNPLY
jgi:hypothetical protein